MQFLKGEKFEPFHVRFSPDGSVLMATGRRNRLLLWQFPEGTLSRQVQGFTPGYETVVFSPDSRACAFVLPTEDTLCEIYPTDRLSAPVKNSPKPSRADNSSLSARCCRFSADGSHLEILARESINSSPRVDRLVHFRRDIESDTLREVSRSVFPLEASLSFVWTLDSSLTWVGMVGLGKVGFWNLDAQALGFEVEIPSQTWVSGLSFSRDGRRFGCYTTNVVHVIDVPKRKHLISFENRTKKYIQSLAFSPDGQTLATVSNDTFVRFWETDTGREVKTYAWEMGQLKAVTIAPDGMRAAAAGKQGKIVVWDLD